MNIPGASKSFRQLLALAALGAVLNLPATGSAADNPRNSVGKANAIEGLSEGFDYVVADGWLAWNRDKEPVRATLGALVKALQMRYTEANIVLTPSLADAEIPDLKLRAHSLAEVLEAIRLATDNRFEWLGPGSPGIAQPPLAAIDPTTGLPISQNDATSATGLYVLRPPTMLTGGERILEAMNLASYIESEVEEKKQTLDLPQKMRLGADLADGLELIIRETLASFKDISEADAERRLKFQYHAGSSLLIVIGPRDDVEVARKVVAAVSRQPIADPYAALSWNMALQPGPPQREWRRVPATQSPQNMAPPPGTGVSPFSRPDDPRTKEERLKALQAEIDNAKKQIDEIQKTNRPNSGADPFPTTRRP